MFYPLPYAALSPSSASSSKRRIHAFGSTLYDDEEKEGGILSKKPPFTVK